MSEIVIKFYSKSGKNPFIYDSLAIFVALLKLYLVAKPHLRMSHRPAALLYGGHVECFFFSRSHYQKCALCLFTVATTRGTPCIGH